jgi:TRAP-type C4-dicarboxylate transport system permease small subunit
MAAWARPVSQPDYWQDEAAVFLLVGAAFMTAAYVQNQRGHMASRHSSDFCRRWSIASGCGSSTSRAFVFARSSPQSWTLAHEAWVDGL